MLIPIPVMQFTTIDIPTWIFIYLIGGIIFIYLNIYGQKKRGNKVDLMDYLMYILCNISAWPIIGPLFVINDIDRLTYKLECYREQIKKTSKK